MIKDENPNPPGKTANHFNPHPLSSCNCIIKANATTGKTELPTIRAQYFPVRRMVQPATREPIESATELGTRWAPAPEAEVSMTTSNQSGKK